MACHGYIAIKTMCHVFRITCLCDTTMTSCFSGYCGFDDAHGAGAPCCPGRFSRCLRLPWRFSFVLRCWSGATRRATGLGAGSAPLQLNYLDPSDPFGNQTWQGENYHWSGKFIRLSYINGCLRFSFAGFDYQNVHLKDQCQTLETSWLTVLDLLSCWRLLGGLELMLAMWDHVHRHDVGWNWADLRGCFEPRMLNFKAIRGIATWAAGNRTDTEESARVDLGASLLLLQVWFILDFCSSVPMCATRG